MKRLSWYGTFSCLYVSGQLFLLLSISCPIHFSQIILDITQPSTHLSLWSCVVPGVVDDAA